MRIAWNAKILYVVCNVKMEAVKNDRVLGARTWQCHWVVSWRGEGFRSHVGHGQKDIGSGVRRFVLPRSIDDFRHRFLYGDRYRIVSFPSIIGLDAGIPFMFLNVKLDISFMLGFAIWTLFTPKKKQGC
jgi:hypothetical protein